MWIQRVVLFLSVTRFSVSEREVAQFMLPLCTEPDVNRFACSEVLDFVEAY